MELFYVYSGKMTRAVKQEKQNMSQTEIYPACRRCRSAVPRVPREIPQDYLTGVGRNYRTGACPVKFTTVTACQVKFWSMTAKRI